MKVLHVLVMRLLVLILLISFSSTNDTNFDENEFAEFEDEDDWAPPPTPLESSEHASIANNDDDVKIEVEDDIFHDEDEFEGGDISPSSNSKPQHKIQFANVPVHRSVNWDKFYMEMLMLLGILVYFINFLSGKSRNNSIANSWLSNHWQLLKANFAFIGDDGRADPGLVVDGGSGEFLRESDSTYSLWCSGRVCCEGMLVQLKLLKRQDLVSVMATMLRGGVDQLNVCVSLCADEMDAIVFAVANRRSAARLVRDMPDLSSYCPERRSAERYGLVSSYVVMSEVHEAIGLLLDDRVCSALNKHSALIDFIHVSDQYTGPKQLDENGSGNGEAASSGLPRCRPTISCRYNLVLGTPTATANNGTSTDPMRELLQLTFFLIDRMKRCRLSKEARAKADRNRQRVQEIALRQTHQLRVEQAQAKRDLKRRLQKERILKEEDPEKQRRMEEKDDRREAKRRQPRMRQMRVKAL